jgi:cobalamin biosynthesis protein CobD/CbiB
VDSLAAPIVAYAVGGLPGRVDVPRHQHRRRDVGVPLTSATSAFGKAAARLDDLANLVPARLRRLGAGGRRGAGRRERP